MGDRRIGAGCSVSVRCHLIPGWGELSGGRAGEPSAPGSEGGGGGLRRQVTAEGVGSESGDGRWRLVVDLEGDGVVAGDVGAQAAGSMAVLRALSPRPWWATLTMSTPLTTTARNALSSRIGGPLARRRVRCRRSHRSTSEGVRSGRWSTLTMTTLLPPGPWRATECQSPAATSGRRPGLPALRPDAWPACGRRSRRLTRRPGGLGVVAISEGVVALVS